MGRDHSCEGCGNGGFVNDEACECKGTRENTKMNGFFGNRLLPSERKIINKMQVGSFSEIEIMRFSQNTGIISRRVNDDVWEFLFNKDEIELIVERMRMIKSQGWME